jgi:hypothetical protein
MVTDNANTSMFCVNCCFYVNNHEHGDNNTLQVISGLSDEFSVAESVLVEITHMPTSSSLKW